MGLVEESLLEELEEEEEEDEMLWLGGGVMAHWLDGW